MGKIYNQSEHASKRPKKGRRRRRVMAGKRNKKRNRGAKNKREYGETEVIIRKTQIVSS